MRVYLDNAATTPLFPEVIDSISSVLRDHFGNPSSIHFYGRNAKSIVEDARKTIANHLNASLGEIFFTSGGTESNNTAIKCAVRDLGVKRIITTTVEHPSVLESMQNLAPFEIECVMLGVDLQGRPNLFELEAHLKQDEKKTLVSIMHANNEIGTMNDIRRIGEICSQNGALFHSDTVQTVAHFPLDLENLHVSFLSGSAHKFHGPKGIGFLYVNSDNSIKPFVDGGGQERTMRSGTENTAHIHGMATAFDICCQNMAGMRNHIIELRDYMKAALIKEVPGVKFNGDPDGESLYTVLSTSFPQNAKTDMLLMNLDIEGIAASGGSACSSGAIKGSHVLEAIDPRDERITIRFSFSEINTRDEIDYVIERIRKILT